MINVKANEAFAQVAGVLYKTAPENLGCIGCVGDSDALLCSRLPAGCSQGSIIWVKASTQPGITDEQTDDHTGICLEH